MGLFVADIFTNELLILTPYRLKIGKKINDKKSIKWDLAKHQIFYYERKAYKKKNAAHKIGLFNRFRNIWISCKMRLTSVHQFLSPNTGQQMILLKAISTPYAHNNGMLICQVALLFLTAMALGGTCMKRTNYPI